MIKNNIKENALIWKIIAKKYKQKPISLFNRYSTLRENLKFLYNV